MSSSVESRRAEAQSVIITADALVVDLVDGRTLTVPLEWYPRLARATQAERDNHQLIGRGTGIRWPDLDEDISVEGLLAGRASQESQTSLENWLQGRRRVG